MNLKLRRRLFVGLLFYAACTQGHQTQRNKIPRYVCAAVHMDMSLTCIRRLVRAYGTTLSASFFFSYLFTASSFTANYHRHRGIGNPS